MPNKGFSLIELLVALAIAAVLAVFFIPQLSSVRSSGQLHTAREQVMSLQTAMDAWLAKAPSVSGARTQFTTGTNDYPTDTSAVLNLLKPYLSPDSQSVFYVDPLDPTVVLTGTMKDIGASMKLKWAGAAWLQEKPRVEFFSP